MKRAAGTYTLIDNEILRTAPKLEGSAGWVLLTLAAQANYSGNPSLTIAEIMTNTGLRERTVERAISILTEKKLIIPVNSASKLRQFCVNSASKLTLENEVKAVPDAKIEAPKEVKELKEVKEVKDSSSTVFSSSLMPTWKLWVLNSKLAGIPLEQNQKDWNRWVELGLEIELQNHALEVLKAGVYEFPVLALLKRMKGVEAVQHAKLEQRVSEECSAAAVLERQAITVGSRWLHPGTKLPLQVAEISGTTVFFEDGGPIEEIWLSHMAGWEALELTSKKISFEQEFKGSGAAA